MAQCRATIQDARSAGRWACQDDDTHPPGAHVLASGEHCKTTGEWSMPEPLAPHPPK